MSFLDELGKRVLLGAGAMGTEFLRRGCLPKRPLDELNLTRSHLVLDLSREYAEAGAEVLKTNTFRSNRISLAEAGLEDQVREINLAGASIARDAARGAFVAGCVGPIGDPDRKDLSDVYQEQCAALAEGGCDLLLLETFTDPLDLMAAYLAARTTALPVACQMATHNGRLLSRFASGLGDSRADLVGVNCVPDEAALFAVRQIGQLTSLPRSAFPDGGTSEKPVSPEEFAAGIWKLVEAGVRLVGGCCGTGPDHIRAAAAGVGKGR